MRRTIVAAAVAAAAVLGTATAAWACHPELAVTADCTTVTVTARAWDTDDPTQRVNGDVRVLLDGAEVGRGAFTAERPSFTVKAKAEPGERVVRVVARAPWGPAGEHGDAFSAAETTVKVPTCAPPTAPPTTTVVAATITPEPQPAVVAAATAPGAAPVLEQPVTVLAFTGRASTALATVGAALALSGVVMLVASARRVGRSTQPQNCC